VTIDVVIRDASDAPAHAPASQQQTSATERVRQIWPVFVLGLGLLSAVAWMTLLGWLLYRAVLMLLA
jgi:hypothetical protein